MTHQLSRPITLDGPGFLRIEQIIPGLLPVSRATFYRGVRNGTYPAPVRISNSCSAWRKSDIKVLLEELGGDVCS